MAADKRPVGAITIGRRHRRDLGDLAPLADSIRAEGLLQPVGITADDELVFGERRLAACRDVLGWAEIAVRVVGVSSIAAGEYAENEMRKDFTPSERVAILQTIERMTHGGDRRSDQRPDLADVDKAAKQVGFSSRQTANNATAVVERGAAELVAAMDRGEVAIDAAAQIARQPIDAQRAIVALPPAQRAEQVKELRAQTKRTRGGKRQARKITIPWSAAPAATELVARWPDWLVRELIAALEARLGAVVGGRTASADISRASFPYSQHAAPPDTIRSQRRGRPGLSAPRRQSGVGGRIGDTTSR